MMTWLKTVYAQRKQLIDQSAHFAGGAIAAGALSVFLPAGLVIGVIMAIAYVREVIQHPDRKTSFIMGVGSQIDLAFWFVGTVVGATITAALI